MPRRNSNTLIYSGLAIFLGLVSARAATAPAQQSLDDSIKQVFDAPVSGTLDPHTPYITRHTLKAEELAAPLNFEVALKMHNFPELQARINRRDHVSREEMASRYQPSAADYEKVVDWLTAQGFTITRRDDAGHIGIFARGTVGQLQQNLGASFARVQFEGKEYSAAITAPNVPTEIAPLLVGINGLQPYSRPHTHILKVNSLTGTNPPYLPSQIAKAYNATPLYTAGLTGSGQTIAIVIDLVPNTSDLVSFWKTYSVNQSLNNIQFVQAATSNSPDTQTDEVTLDTEWSSSIAPGAKVRVYTTSNLDFANLDAAYVAVYNDAMNHPELGLHQMSMSYGGAEAGEPTSQLSSDDQLFANLVSVGVTVFASSGDSGSELTYTSASTGQTVTGLMPENPASDPNVTGVGGTSLLLNNNGSESSEIVWNDSYGAGGGGTSHFFSRPSWQTGTGVAKGSKRLVPDISLTADPTNGGVVILNGSQLVYGGTSWSSPTVAAFCALINEAQANLGQSPIGFLNPLIYPLIGTSSFRDITSGNNRTDGASQYSAGVGYDEASGIGVPLVQPLMQALTGSSSAVGVQPSPVQLNLMPGQTATYTVTAGGSPTGYQWQRLPAGLTTWANVSNGGGYSGATSATLTVTPVTPAMSGDQFQCVVTYSGPSTLTSTPPSVLSVETPYTTAPFAGTVGTANNADGTGSAATFNYPSGVALDSFGDVFVADYSNNSIREITPNGAVSTPYTGFTLPNSVAVDGNNNLYIANTGANLIQKISGGTLSSIGTSATYNSPNGVAVDGSDNVYVADTNNDVIREISPSGNVTTLAGSVGVSGYADSPTGSSALFNSPSSVAVDGNGNVYVADLGNQVIRKITPGGAVSTLAGLAGVAGYLDGVGTTALFNGPNGVAVDTAGNVYVTDATIPPIGSLASGNCLIRKINPSGVVSTLIGQAGVSGSATGTGPAAQFYSPQSMAISSTTGEMFIADVYNQVIRTASIFSQQPASEIVTAGQPINLSGSLPVAGATYQWQKDGSVISGATNSTYTIPSSAGTDTGLYSLVANGTYVGPVTSAPANIIVVASQPGPQIVMSGNPTTFAIVPPSTGAPFSYQWYFNGVAIPGATGSSYVIGAAFSSNAGNYSVAVTDSYGTAITTPVSLTIIPDVDTPTMPMWALLLLGGLLFVAGLPRFCRMQRESR